MFYFNKSKLAAGVKPEFNPYRHNECCDLVETCNITRPVGQDCFKMKTQIRVLGHKLVNGQC